MKLQLVHHLFSCDSKGLQSAPSPTVELQICATLPDPSRGENWSHLCHLLKSTQAKEVTVYGEESGVIIDDLVSALLANKSVDKVHFTGVQFCSSFLHKLRERFSVVWVEYCKVDPLPEELSFILYSDE